MEWQAPPEHDEPEEQCSQSILCVGLAPHFAAQWIYFVAVSVGGPAELMFAGPPRLAALQICRPRWSPPKS